VICLFLSSPFCRADLLSSSLSRAVVRAMYCSCARFLESFFPLLVLYVSFCAFSLCGLCTGRLLLTIKYPAFFQFPLCIGCALETQKRRCVCMSSPDRPLFSEDILATARAAASGRFASYSSSIELAVFLIACPLVSAEGSVLLCSRGLPQNTIRFRPAAHSRSSGGLELTRS